MTTGNFELGESSGELLLTSPAQVAVVLEFLFRQARHSLLVQASRLDFEFLRTQDLLLLLAPRRFPRLVLSSCRRSINPQ